MPGTGTMIEDNIARVHDVSVPSLGAHNSQEIYALRRREAQGAIRARLDFASFSNV